MAPWHKDFFPSMKDRGFHSYTKSLLKRMVAISVLLGSCGTTMATPDDHHGYLADILAAGDYSRRGADTCLGCHDESEPFPTAAVFETAHGHPGVDGSPFMPGSSASFPAGLQCEACHGPIGEHGQRILPDGAVREPIVNFGKRGNASADLQNHFCLACHQDYGRSRWEGSAHEQADMACASCHRIHSRSDPVQMQTGQAEVCLDCHRPVRADLLKLSSHPMRDHQLACRDCHDPHGGSGTGDALVREASINQTCYGCHAEKRGPFLWEHPPASEDCGICHQPHGSNQPALLVRRAPQLCQACHSSVGHRSLPQTGERLPSDPSAEFLFANACLNCHSQVHGSNHPSGNLLRR